MYFSRKKDNRWFNPVVNITAYLALGIGEPRPDSAVISLRRHRASVLGGLIGVLTILMLSAGSATAQCALSLPRVTTSGCYSVSGVSKATISVEVAWQNAPANGYIVVTTGAQSRTITPGVITVNYGNGGTASPTGSQTIVSPQVVAFEVNATGATGALTAQFSNSATCSATGSFVTPTGCLPTVCASGGLGGQVFNDYNANGIKESGETNGVAGVNVTIYPCVGNSVSATTDAYGIWSTSASLAYPVRVEFTNIPAAYLNSSTLQGTGSRTTVQFVAQSQCSVNLGVNDPTDYCQDNPLLVLPTYISGDPLVSGGTAGAYRGLIGFPYAASGVNLNYSMTFTIPSSSVGSLWAQAYNKVTKRLFSAAAIRRHEGLGPGGLDAIYITNLTNQASPSTPTYIKLSTLGIDVGTIVSNTARGLVGDKSQQSTDAQSFSLIGAVGIGGMSMSSDGNTLYLMNIKNGTLHALDLSTYNTTLNPADISVKGSPYAVPSLGCVNGVQRSWAVKYSKGKVYVGTVCDASTGTKSNLRAGVFVFDPSTNSFSTQPIFDFPLSYPKGYADWAITSVTGWFPWSNSFDVQKTPITFGTGADQSVTLIYPQPMLSDIEFDIDGSMILALGDRAGMQQGHRNHDLSGNGDYSGRVGGDLLRAFSRQGVFVLENAAKAGPVVGSRPIDNQGPGFGEFYVDDSGAGAGSDGLYHAEVGLGSLALRPGSGEVVAGIMDPTGVNTAYSFTPFSGGVRRMNNATGQVNDAFALYSSSTSSTRDGTFAKATGLGDLELLCDQQQILEIGNRVWLDDNKDGIQDACESVLAGVNVALYRNGTLIASTTTNANGEYYFNNLPTSSTLTGTVSTTSLLPNTAYQLVFGTSSQFSGTTLSVNNGKYSLTTANSTSASGNDLNDSDAQIATVAGITAPVINITTGAYGVINHALDAGFSCLPTTAGSISTTVATCNVGTGTTQSNARITVSAIVNADRAFLTTTTSIPSYTATGSQPVSASAVSFTGLSNPTSSTGTAYNVVLYNGPNCYTVISTNLAQATCCVLQGVTANASACTPATNQYSVSGTVSLTNSPAQSLTISDGVMTQVVSVAAGQSSVPYTFAGLVSGTGSHTVTVLASNTTSCGLSVNAIYSAPASCSIGLNVSVTPGVCQSATNGYSITGTISLTNAIAGTATITDGTSTTTVTVAAGATSVAYSLGGLNSGTGSHTVTVSYVDKVVSQLYTAPASCTVGVALSVTPGVCQSATNGYSITGTVSLTNAVAGVATITDGTSTTTVTVAAGATSVNYSLSGLTSGTDLHTVTVSYVGKTASQTYTAPVSCTVGVGLTATAGTCLFTTNSYTVTGTLSLTNAVAGLATITDGTSTTTIAVAAGTTSVSYSLSGLTSGTGSHTVTVSYAGKTASQIYTAPASCTVGVALSVTPGVCQSATNGYSITGTISLTNAIAGVATITDGAFTTTVAISAGETTATYSLSGLMSGTGSHTVTVSYADKVVSQTYTAPASCTVGVALSVTPGVCQSVTNGYSITGTISLTNAVAGVATITDGTSTTTVAISAGETTAAYSLSGLSSGTGSHTVTVSYADKVVSQLYTAPASCTVGVALSVTPGVCQSATNGYSITGTISLTNAVAGVATITDGTSTTTVAISAGETTATYSLSGLTSGTGSHTVTVSYAGKTASQIYTAPASCTVGVALSVTPGVCQSATNGYSITGTVSLTNAVSGVATITDGTSTTTVAISAGETTATYLLIGLTSGTGSHTVTVSYADKVVSQTYTAPASCTVGVALSVTPGVCQSATNGYSITGTISLTNAIAGTATITDGTSTTTVAISAGETTATYLLIGLTSGTGSHTVTVSYADKVVSQVYAAPASCTVGVALSVTPGVCQSATNGYSITGTISLTNAVAGVATITDGTSTTTVSISAGETTAAYSLSGLSSGTGSHTVTVSYADKVVSQTYTAPASCTVGVALSVTPGVCQSATNGYSITGTISLTNAVAGVATITDGTSTTTVAISAGETTAAYSLSGLSSGTGSHTVTVSYADKVVSQLYTAPASCTVGVALSVTPGVCQSATNGYSISGIISLTNAIAGLATITDGMSTTTVSISAGETTATYSLSGLTSGTGSHTVTVSYADKVVSQVYTAPASCTVGVALSVTPGVCQSATNGYSITGTISLTNAVAGVATITDGMSTTTVSISAGETTAAYSLSGLTSGTNSHTVTVSYADKVVSQTYTAPASCTLGVALLITPGMCQSATNGYSITGTLSLTNAQSGVATFTDGLSSTSVAVSSGQSSVSFSLSGLTSGTGSHTLTAVFAGQTQTQVYTAPASCTVGVALSVTPGVCQSATNGYSITGTISLTNAVAGVATITDGTSTTTVSVAAGATSVSYSLGGLTSGTGSHTVTVSYADKVVNQIYTAPASCTLGVALLITPGMCQSATNGYSITGTLSLTNAQSGVATFTDGVSSTSVMVSSGQSSVSFSLSGLTSGTGSHTLTAVFAGQTQTQVYTAPASCTVGVALSVTPGMCQSATNGYSISGILSLTNAVAGVATITDGTSTTSVAISAGETTATYSLSGLSSGTGSHTVTVSYADKVVSQTYTAPASCTVGVALSVTPGMCQSATNGYSITGIISLTNAIAGVATITDGTSTTTVSISAGETTAAYSLSGLSSGTGSHTVTVSYADKVVSQVYTAPASCTVGVALSVTPGMCQSATNGYSISGTISLTNAVAGVATITDGASTTSVAISAGETTAAYSLSGLTSGTGSHTVTVSYADKVVNQIYTAPASCTLGVALLITPGMCQSATNGYSITGTISLTNAIAGVATITDGTSTTTVAISAGEPTAAYSLSGLSSGTGSHTVTVSYADKVVSQTYTAPASCTLGVALLITPGVCSSATNGYSITGTLSLTNAQSGVATFTDGLSSTSVAVSSGQSSVSFSLSGLTSGTGSHTLTAVFAGQAQTQVYTAPASCTVGVALSVTPGMCQSATNGYSITGTISLTNAVAGLATITDGTSTTTVSVAAGATSVSYSLGGGLTSGTGSHTVTVSYADKVVSQTYTAPASCTVGVALSVTPGMCQSATNGYSITGILSLTNAVAGVATITDGTSTTTVAISAGETTATYLLIGLTSGTGSRTVTVSYADKVVSQVYTAPASCTVGVALSVTPGMCQSATNGYSITGTLSLTNAIAGVATITDGTSTTTVAISAGETIATYSLSGLSSGTGSHTVTVSYADKVVSQTYTAPASCTLGVALLITPGVCSSATNGYSITGTLSLTNAQSGMATFTDGLSSTSVAVSSGQSSVSFSLSGLTSGTGSHTVTAVFAGQTQTQVYTAPASCTVGVALSVTPGMCQSATNGYSISGILSLTNAVAGVATITDGMSTTTVAISAGETTATYSLSGLTSGTGSHTVTVSYADKVVSQTYTAPASCTLGVALLITPGVCSSATNGYSITGTLSLTNAQSGVATFTDGLSSTSVAVSSGQSSVSFSLSGLTSGTGSHTLTAVFAGQTQTQVYTAPASCTVGVALSVTPGVCQSATNGYSITGTISLTNAVAGVATITDGTSTTTVSVAAGATSVSYSLGGLTSGTGSHTVTVSYADKVVSQTYTAPASCTLGVALLITPGVCSSATNGYSITGTLSLTNAQSGVATFMDGVSSTSVAVSSGQSSVSFSLSGLTSGTGSHTLTAVFAGQTQTQVYTAPASCTVGVALSVTPGMCQSATNGYSITGTISLTNAVAGVATITDGTSTTTVSISAGEPTAAYSLSGLSSGTGSHTVTVSYADKVVSQTYTAPASCTVGVALSVTPGVCQSATNGYSITGTISLTNAVAGVATITDGTSTTTVSISAGETTAAYSLSGLTSGTGSHTVTVSYADKVVSQTYTAPASCTLGVALLITPGVCSSATNGYSITGTLSLTNAQAGVATFTDGVSSTSVAVSSGQSSVSFSLSGLTSGTGSHTLTAVFAGQTQTQVYTAPASCTVGVALSVTPGVCQSATNGYSITGTISLTNAVAGVATITDGTSTTTVAISAGETTAAYSLSGLTSGTGSHTVTVSYADKVVSQTYTAPASCTVGVALRVTPGVCQSATNGYSITGAISLTNAVAGVVTITDGTSTTTVSVAAGATSVSYSLGGLTSGTGSHTVTVSYADKVVSQTYTAPASCTLGVTLLITSGVCQSATNGYSITGTLSLTNAQSGVATFTDGLSSTSVAVSSGQSSVSFSLSGLTSGTSSHTLTAVFAGQTQTQLYTAPASCKVGLAITATDPGVCQPATNIYTTTGVISFTNAVANTATITDGTSSEVILVTAGQTTATYSLTGISGTGSHTVVVTYMGSTASAVYTAPASCTTVPKLTLLKRVSQSVAAVGNVLTYTLVLTNTGLTSTTATVRDSLSTGASYVAASASAPAGTTFTAGSPVSLWTVPIIGAGQSLTLTFQVRVDDMGIIYNTASIPGDTNRVCTSVPIKICQGDEYAITAPAGRAAYRWYRDGVLIVGATANVLSVTASGSYSLGIDNVANCPDFSCCPVLIEVDSIPVVQVVATPATCLGSVAQQNGKLTLRGFKSVQTYQYSAGTTFNPAASLSGAAQVIPANGILTSQLPSPASVQFYTIRVYNQQGCYTDQTVQLMPTVCGCPVVQCAPFVLQQTKRPKRIGDAR